MPTVIAHAAAGFAAAAISCNKKGKHIVSAAAVPCAVIPDADAISFAFGIPYGDMLGHRGLGVAFFAPFSGRRYFLSWRPIPVSPIGVAASTRAWTMRVLWYESVHIVMPALLAVGGIHVPEKPFMTGIALREIFL